MRSVLSFIQHSGSLQARGSEAPRSWILHPSCSLSGSEHINKQHRCRCDQGCEENKQGQCQVEPGSGRASVE